MPDLSARHVCTTALRLLGVAAADQPIEADMADAALGALNALIDAWATERVLTYTRPTLLLPLTPGKGTYTWGMPSTSVPVPDLALPPPVRLELALLTIGGQPEQEWPLQVVDQARYELGVSLKTLASTYPELLYLEASQPLARLHVWCVPTLPYVLKLLPWIAQAPYAHWDHALPWPNGYLRAFQYNLAVDLGPQYGIEASPTVQRIADESKRLLGNVNVQVGRMTSDDGCLRQSDIPVANIPAFERWGA